METIKEIVRVVTSKADIKKVFPELVDPDGTNTITANFVRGLIDNDYSTDDEAAEALYGADRSDQRYRTLKSRIYDRLLVALLNLQVKQPEHSLYLSMYYKCSRNSVASQTLMRFASRKAGAQLAERTLQIADKFHFTDLQIALLYSLRTSMSFQRNKRLYGHYHERLSHLLTVQGAEIESDYLLDQALLDTGPREGSKDIISHYNGISDKVKKLKDTYNTNTLNLNYFRIRTSLFELSMNYAELIRTCDEALTYFQIHKHFSLPARVGEFSLMKAIACSSLRRHSEALDVADVCISSFNSGGNNWYLSLDIAFTAAMNSSEYERATVYYLTATEDHRLSLQPSFTQERWTTYGAYLYLAQQFGLLQNETAFTNKSFRLNSFLNSVPEFSKEKKFANFLIIVSHICFLIVGGQFDTAERRIEYLRTYCARYLKEPQFDRSRVFLKILLVFSKEAYSATEIETSIAPLLEELRELDKKQTANDVNEIIPYGVLSKELLNSLYTMRNTL